MFFRTPVDTTPDISNDSSKEVVSSVDKVENLKKKTKRITLLVALALFLIYAIVSGWGLWWEWYEWLIGGLIAIIGGKILGSFLSMILGLFKK
mgnify:CR=1 FL=1